MRDLSAVQKTNARHADARRYCLVNIGLARNDGRPDNKVDGVLAFLERLGFNIGAYRVAQSSTEQTLIVQLGGPGALAMPAPFFDLLAQDCIAVRDETGQGSLVGPKAADWGEFDPAQFLELAV